MSLTLRYRGETTLPVEVDGLLPAALGELALPQIERFTIHHGKHKLPLAELFDVAGDAADLRIDFEGDLSGVHYIGSGLREGAIHIHGPAGRHVGSGMHQGEIVVHGKAGDWLGAEMRGGMLRVTGSAGDLVGAAYRGSPRGMRGGTILVSGDAGHEAGCSMRRGLIVIGGDCGDLVGFSMLAGNVYVFGDCGRRQGAAMRRGTLGLFGPQRPVLLPTFRKAGSYRPQFLQLLFQQLKRRDFAVPEELTEAEFELYHGDMVELGRGEILVRKT